jgi:hypothetical protein
MVVEAAGVSLSWRKRQVKRRNGLAKHHSSCRPNQYHLEKERINTHFHPVKNSIRLSRTLCLVGDKPLAGVIWHQPSLPPLYTPQVSHHTSPSQEPISRLPGTRTPRSHRTKSSRMESSHIPACCFARIIAAWSSFVRANSVPDCFTHHQSLSIPLLCKSYIPYSCPSTTPPVSQPGQATKKK